MSRTGGAAIAVALVATLGGAAKAAEPTNAELLERIEKLENQSVYVKDLEQEVQILERELEVQDEAAASKGPAPVIGAGPDGYFLQSADKNFVIELRGYTPARTRRTGVSRRARASARRRAPGAPSKSRRATTSCRSTGKPSRRAANPDKSAREAQGATLGVNWYLNRFLEFGVNYEHTWFDGGAPDGGNRDAEDLVSTRFQLNY